MHQKSIFYGITTALMLSGCGGGGSSDSTATPVLSAQPYLSGYSFIYQQIITDNANNAINSLFQVALGAKAADGTYTVKKSESSSVLNVNGTRYGGRVQTSYLDSEGNIYRLDTTSDAGTVSCSYSPSRPHLPTPLYMSSTWSSTITSSCSNGLISQLATTEGKVIGVESITVTSGTYQVAHVQMTTTATSASIAYTKTSVIDGWYDIKTGILVQESEVDSYAGSLPTYGYPIKSISTLQQSSSGG